MSYFEHVFKFRDDQLELEVEPYCTTEEGPAVRLTFRGMGVSGNQYMMLTPELTRSLVRCLSLASRRAQAQSKKDAKHIKRSLREDT